MSYPNNECGSCPAWLSVNTSYDVSHIISTTCKDCNLFNSQKFVCHIPSGCCYPLEDDGKTITTCGASLTPTIDGIVWKYTDKFTYKEIKPVNPFEAALNIIKERSKD